MGVRGATAVQSLAGDRRARAAATALAGGPERSIDVAGDVRLLALPVTTDGRRVGTVVAGISLEPYQRTRVIALISSIALACALLAAVGLASAAILRAALRPGRG